MTLELSILIPTYNHVCLPLVSQLVAQAQAIEQLRWEIIVADDGSTDQKTIEQNRPIADMPCCQYILRGHNSGRACIRNFLARNAQYGKSLFIDSDMRVVCDDYLRRYLDAEGQVVYGSYQVMGDALPRNLRYRYELAAARHRELAARQRAPYLSFRTCNFLASSDLMVRHPFDERFTHYGFEDVMLGKTLQEAHVAISHIDAPLGFATFETNARFMEKTEEGLRTLLQFRGELAGFTSLLHWAGIAQRWHLAPLVRLWHRLCGASLRRWLIQGRPPLCLFQLYKLGYFMSIQTPR